MQPPSKREYIARLNRVLEHINAHINENLSLETLARVACFSPFHFHRIFSALVGETPPDFVKRLRLERAALMLRQLPSTPVTSIALACGFSSSAVFSRAFRERFGVTPTLWRTPERQLSKNRKTERKNCKASTLAQSYPDSAVTMKINRQERTDAMDVVIKELPEKHIAYAANLRGYKKEKIKAVWDRLCTWAGPLGLLNERAEMIGISFDNPAITPENKCRYYACVTIPRDVSPPRDIGVMDIPSGRYAVNAFEGPEQEIGAAYRRLYGTWLPSSGYQPADRPCYEIYLNNPEDDPEGLFLMEICMPVEPLQE